MGIKSDLEANVKKIYSEEWSRRDGRKVPDDSDVTSGNDAVDLYATILYADLDQSTNLVDNYEDYFAAENYKTFLQCASKLIRGEGGEIRSFDGDRVMGVFIGNSKNTSAVRCALKINYAVKEIIQPAINRQYKSSDYIMRHVVGIDTTKIMIAKAGIRNSNDLVWIGQAANHAAKLSAMNANHATWITDKIFDNMNDKVKFCNGNDMCEKRNWVTQNNRTIYRSNYHWIIQ